MDFYVFSLPFTLTSIVSQVELARSWYLSYFLTSSAVPLNFRAQYQRAGADHVTRRSTLIEDFVYRICD